jgi:hypothetical protein
MKLSLDPRLPAPVEQSSKPLYLRLIDLFREYSKFINTAAMWDSEGAAAPTAGRWAQGDKCRKTAPVEDGAPGAKYVVVGWVCVVSGSPGTWVEMRVLTGN